MKKYIILILVGMLLLPSCSLYKKYEADYTADEQTMGDIVDTQDSTSIGDINWRDIFKDPKLQQLIDTALANNTDMRTAQLTIEQAQNDVMSAKWGYAPTFSFVPSATFNHNYNGITGNYYQIPVQASWQIGIFGQTRSKIRSAKARVAYYEDYRQAVQVDLAANVASYYYFLVMLDRQLKISEETEKLYEESYNATEALFQAGIYNSPAVYEMLASLESLRANIVDLRNYIATTEASLCLLLNEPPHHIDRATFEEFEMPEEIHLGLPVRLLDARPDVRMAERQMELAYYSTQQARQDFYPSISINALVGLGGSDALEFMAQLMGSISQPIFQGGRLTAQLRNAKKDQEIAQLEFAYSLYNAGKEVYTYIHDCETTGEKAEHIDKQVDALQEAYDATIELMNHGSTTYLEVLNAQESLLSAELTQVQNQYNMIQSLINLYTALGGFGTK